MTSDVERTRHGRPYYSHGNTHAQLSPAALPNGLRIPDLSNYRTVSDWSAFARTYPVAACLATEGAGWVDPYWPTFLAGCRAHGIFPIGYHFLENGDVGAQVNNYVHALDGGPVGVMLDVETSGSGTNPTMAQANDWHTGVAGKLRRPRSGFATYLPRWWWNSRGSGSHAVSDTLCWNSDYNTTPSLTGYAGWPRVNLIQYGSAITITGLSSPGSGDMSVAIGLTPAALIARLTASENTIMAGLTKADADLIANAILAKLSTQILSASPHINQANGGEVIGATYNKIGAAQTQLAQILDLLGLTKADVDFGDTVVGQLSTKVDTLNSTVQALITAITGPAPTT